MNKKRKHGSSSSQIQFQTPVLARVQAFAVAVLLSRVLIGWIIPSGRNSFSLLKSVGLPENWEGLLSVVQFKFPALGGSCDEILRLALPVPCPLPGREGQDDARDHHTECAAGTLHWL